MDNKAETSLYFCNHTTNQTNFESRLLEMQTW